MPEIVWGDYRGGSTGTIGIVWTSTPAFFLIAVSIGFSLIGVRLWKVRRA